MDEAGLPVSALPRVWLSLEGSGKFRELERNYGTVEASARMRPQPLV
jgi:hypothetical protein